MSTQIQYRRGTNAQNDAFTGALAEITVDTTNKTLRVHDGITAGGYALVGLAASQTLTNKIYQGTSMSVTGSITGNSAVINGDLTVTGNATLSGNIVGSRLQNGTTEFDIPTVSGNANLTIAGVSNVAVFASTGIFVTGLASVTGNVNAGNVIATGSIQGASVDSVNADLAERYQSDQEYAAGTVVIFGGDQEITQSQTYADSRIAGVISTAPAYRMNVDADGQYVALQGRVPCRIVGKISKGDLVTSSNQSGVATRLDPVDWRPGCVIGKALANYNSLEEGVIEVVVGRL